MAEMETHDKTKMTPSAAQQRAEEWVKQWLEQSTYASDGMVKQVVELLVQARQDTLEEVRGRISEYNHKDLVKGGIDGLLAELDRLSSEET